MPVMDGITAVKTIRQQEAQCDHQLGREAAAMERQLVIALTGNARQEQIDHAQQSGMDDGESMLYVLLGWAVVG